jgi:hypothetical protein
VHARRDRILLQFLVLHVSISPIVGTLLSSRGWEVRVWWSKIFV